MALARGQSSKTGVSMLLSGPSHDPETLAMLYRVLNAAFQQSIPDPSALDDAGHQAVREKLARALVNAYECGEHDPELLAFIAVQSNGPLP